MLLNFKRNFTYLSCGAHSLRCSFERSFRQPTSCLPACLHPLQLPPLQRAVQTCPTGHTAWRLHQASTFFFSRRIFCRCCFLFALAIFNNSSEFGCSSGEGCAGGPSLPLTLICGHIARAHKSGLFASLSLALSTSYASFPAADFHLTCSFRFRFNDALIGLAVCA